MPALLEIKNLSFAYDQDILKDISLTINKGEIVSLLGVNGAGKSTLLKCIIGPLKADGGQVLLKGQDLRDLDKKDLARSVAYVSQYNQATSNTVYDTVLMGRVPHIQARPSKADYEIVEEIISRMGLEDLVLKRTSQLSGGQYQLVVLARALAQEPSLMILDEPTANLDIKNQVQVMELIWSYCKNKEISVVLSIHDINLALQFSDKFILLKDGYVYGSGEEEIINPTSIKEVFGLEVDCPTYKGRKLLVNL